MIQSVTYRDLRGREIDLSGLDDEERQLADEIQRRAAEAPAWNDFDNEWVGRVGEFYQSRGLTRREITRTAVWRIAQDLSGRLAIEQGHARAPDYRDELEDLIRERFRNRREFCRATGISEDMLSHVLARRKHIAINTLNDALARVGYTLRIEPLETE